MTHTPSRRPDVLGRHRPAYVLATLLLMGSLFWRSLEPRVLQVLIDQVYGALGPGGRPVPVGTDIISRVFAWCLPALTADNLPAILLRLGLLYWVIGLGRAGFLFASSALKESAAERAINELRDRLFAHIQRLPMAYFAVVSKGELVQRSTGDIDTVKRFVSQQLIALFRLSSSLGFGFLMMAMLNWRYALISVMLAPVIGVVGYLFYQRERAVWREHEAEADRLSSLVQENLNGIRAVTAFANQRYEIDRFDRQNRRKRAMGLKQARIQSLFHPLSDWLVDLQITISVLAGGYFALRQEISIGELLGFFAYVTQIAWPMREIGRLLSQMGQARVALDRLAEISQTLPESAVEPATDAEPDRHLAGDIAFERVSFRYHPAAPFALADLSFSIRAGEKIALIGPTGSGKSTLIKLLLRLYEPDTGQLLIDGQPATGFSRTLLRQRIGVTLQQAFLFSTSIAANIAYTRPDADADAIDRAARLAQARELKTRFPTGYETIVGENGVTLSGGQKQRVALARTLLSEPDVLVLDDTTSAVDTLTEQAIFAALDEAMPGKTLIIISHRLSSICQADRILVLDRGRLVQQGTPDELANQPGYFQTISQPELV
jgi:ATP-binding cassette, subfamily B, bacterial